MNAKTILLAILGILTLYGLALAEWTEPVPITEVNTEYAEWTPFLSFDGLSLYFARGRTSGYYHFRIFEATRQEPYGPFTSVNEILSTSGKHLFSPWVSPNNLRMYYFAQTEHPILWQIKISERASVNDPWPQGTDISELNSLGRVTDPRLTSDELIIFFRSPTIPGGLGGYDLWMATRPDRASPFDNVRNLAEINTAAHDISPYVSPDGLTLLFQSGTYGDWQLFKATRQSLSEPFGNIEQMPILEIPGYTNNHPGLSSDGSELYFIRLLIDDSSIADIYVSYWIVDLYEDAVTAILDAIDEKLDALEKVNAALEKEWTVYEALQELLDSGDYGDLKKGDIITAMQKIYSSIQHEELAIKTLDRSIEKLEDALAALGWQPPPEPQPVSHWKFDEGSGTIAYDSVAINDGTVYGATWTSGQINGALSFDGLNDYVDMADTVKNYLDTSYTVSAWIKINTISLNKIILAYRHSTDVNPVLFALGQYYTDVHFAVRDNSLNLAQPAFADAITTNTWYHIAGVREENTVNVYVNGVSGNPVSKTFGAISPDNLLIGAQQFGGNPVLDHFDGTIDDVRLYNSALSAQEIKQLYNNGSEGF